MENRHKVYRGEDCMKKFCESLREHEMKIINFEKKKRVQLKNECMNSILTKQTVTFTKKSLKINTPMTKLM